MRAFFIAYLSAGGILVTRRVYPRTRKGEYAQANTVRTSVFHFNNLVFQSGMVKRLTKIPHGVAFPSNQEFLSEVDRFLELELKKAGFGKDLIADLAISVSEFVNNAILHGNRQDEAKLVTLELFFRPGEVIICVEDEGDGFDPNQIANPLEGENLLKEVGRGIFIAKTLVDAVEFEKGKKGGTRVKLTKKLP